MCSFCMQLLDVLLKYLLNSLNKLCKLAKFKKTTQRILESTFTYPLGSGGDLKPYMFYGDSEHISISDINDPSYQLSALDLSINEIPPNSGSVYESAYFYQDNHLYKR